MTTHAVRKASGGKVQDEVSPRQTINRLVTSALRAKAKDAVVIILTSYGTVEEAVEAMKLGAYDFIIKTVDLQLVEPVVNQALEHLALRRQAGKIEKLSSCLERA